MLEETEPPKILDMFDSILDSEISHRANEQEFDKIFDEISMNLSEANSSTPKVQFNIGDTARLPVEITPLENEGDSGFISSEAVNTLMLNKVLENTPACDQFPIESIETKVSLETNKFYFK